MAWKSHVLGHFLKSMVSECCSIRGNDSGPGNPIVDSYMTFIETENTYFLNFPF